MARYFSRYFSRYFFVAAFAVLLMGFVPDQALPDPEKEAQAQYIIAQLRCFVCQGQPLAQSDVALARDLRRLVRDKIAEGQSTQQIISFITDRYGRDVLMNPPFDRQTFILWLLPFIVFVLGGIWLWRITSGRRA